MKNENVIFGQECQNKLIEGVDEIVRAIESTYGPNAKNAIIRTMEGIRVTKDGYNTACMINDPDPYRSMGIDLIQDLCKRTAHDIGDGTSTVAILARAIVNQYKDSKNPIQTSRELKELGVETVSKLKELKQQVTCKEDLKKVATVSANNDAAIGKLIADAFELIGKDGIVTFQETEDIKDSIEYTNGFQIGNGFFSPYFVNTPHNTCELENVYVYISDTKIEEVKKVVDVASFAIHEKKSLLLMAPDFDSEVLIFLKENLDKLKSCCVRNPNNRNYREIMLSDLRLYLGESSSCEKVKITQNTCVFLGCQNNEDEIKKRVEGIKLILENTSLLDLDKTFHQKRLANFTSGVAIIKIGGVSPVEIKEKYDRIEDAVMAAGAALKEGYVIGGGLTLKYIAETSSFPEKFKNVLMTPSLLLETSNQSLEEMEKKGVFDPYLVVASAIENAISVASLILTADVAIINMNSLI